MSDNVRAPRPGIIYIDLAYTRAIVERRGHEDYWHARDSDGYFGRVWGVHPTADVPDREERHEVRVSRFSPVQISIEGTSRCMRWPRALDPLNLLISQSRLLIGLIRAFRRRDAAVVFANDPLYCGLFGLLLAWGIRRPLVVFIPAEYDQGYADTGRIANPRLLRFRWVEQALMHLVFRKAKMVIAAADSIERLARRYGADPQRIARLRHGKYIARAHLADPQERHAPPWERLRIPEASNYLIFFGRHNVFKHPTDALRAMGYVLERREDVIGIFGGDGEMREDLERLATALGCADRVVFTGLLDQRTLSELLPHAITLSPLAGMALIESALAGSPIVAYDLDWQAEFVEDGRSGFIVPGGDWRAMGDRALNLVDEFELRSRFSRAIRCKALAFVDRKGAMAEEHAAYDKLLQQNPKPLRENAQAGAFA